MNRIARPTCNPISQQGAFPISQQGASGRGIMQATAKHCAVRRPHCSLSNVQSVSRQSLAKMRQARPTPSMNGAHKHVSSKDCICSLHVWSCNTGIIRTSSVAVIISQGARLTVLSLSVLAAISSRFCQKKASIKAFFIFSSSQPATSRTAQSTAQCR